MHASEINEIGALLQQFGTGGDPRLDAVLAQSLAAIAAEEHRLHQAADAARLRANALRKARRHAEADPMRCEAGLRFGHQAVRRRQFSFTGPFLAQTPRLGPLEAFSGPNAILEAHPRLDVRVLARTDGLRAGTHSRHALRWEGEAGPGDVLVEIDLPLEGSGTALIQFRRHGADLVQEIAMVVQSFGARHRPWFICPVRGEKCEVLAFREGRFASIGAQRLQHRSQTPAVRARKPRKTIDKR